MTERENLIALLTTEIECDMDGHGDCSMCKYKYSDKDCERHICNKLADHLLENGVIVPPCKIGQICYKVWQGKIFEVRVVSIGYEPLPAFSYTIRFNSLGVLCLLQDGTRNEKYSWDIYLTREEAEAKLKGGEQG